jgi:hydroxypyruvate isomerase
VTVARLAPNLSFLWTELPFLERFAAAREAGFTAVEYMFPYPHPASQLRSRLDEAGLEQVLFNLPAGDWGAGDRGIASDPARVDEFRAGVDQALAYARELDVPQCNCLAGLRVEGVEPARQWSTLVENVRHAARRLKDEGRSLLVEPVNTFDVPGFLLPTTEDALRLLDEAGDPGVLLQFDAYHVQRMEGDPAGRHQPGTGEIDFGALFALLESAGYAGSVGLEYVPRPDTAGSLSWLDRFGSGLTQRS